MDREVDYVLKRLDEWNYKRSKERYTSEVAGKIARELAKKFFDSPNLATEVIPSLIDFISVDNQLEEARHYFSSKYACLEEILKNKELPGRLKEMPAGIKNEYILPMAENFQPLVKFVDKTREECVKIFPVELEDELIEDCFKSVFPRREDYMKMIYCFIDNLKPALDILRNLGRINLSESEIEKYLENMKEISNSINKEIMRDTS